MLKKSKKCVRISRFDLNTELSAKNTTEATGTLAIPMLRYNFRTFNWHQKKNGQKTRKMLTIHGQHHPIADI
jgi:hypothetical protein